MPIDFSRAFRLAVVLLLTLGMVGMGAAGATGVLGRSDSPAVVENAQIRAELVAHAPQGIGPGKPLWLGLQLRHATGWHTYWKNPGDSGLPTELHWTLPSGWQASAIEWPLPQRVQIGALANYGYEN
jgi:thiol:disulfide interchange protein DsbD